MKKMFQYGCACLIAFFPRTVLAQDLPTIVPPTPEATSLAKFIDTPVSPYTGLANINIPFYTIEQGGITIPIGLSYHARGVMVEELASQVGLGWALNYGGSLSRQTRGKQDESGSNGYLVNKAQFSGFRTNFNSRFAIGNIHSLNPDYDYYPDVFHFSAAGTSGKFILDYMNGQPLLQEFDDVIIEYNREFTPPNEGNIISFEITDKAGNKFYYGMPEIPNSLRNARNSDVTLDRGVYRQSSGLPEFFGAGSQELYFNSWQLIDIVTPDGSKIEFEYELEDMQHYSRSYDKLESYSSNSYFSLIRSNQYQIKSIKFKSGRIVFTRSIAEREDVKANGHTLNKIEVFDNHDKLIKSYTLDYEYSTSLLTGNESPYLAGVALNASKRLFLKSVTEVSMENPNNNLPPFLFEYSSVKLPHRFSNSQDAWGYYNQKDNGAYLTFFQQSNSISRNVDVNASEAGLLQSIKYPTGGEVNFTYEHNIVNRPSFYNDILISESNPIKKYEVQYTKNSFTFSSSDNAYYKTFYIGDDRYGAKGTYNLICQSFVEVGDPDPFYCNFDFYLQKLDHNDNVVATYGMTKDIDTDFFLSTGFIPNSITIPGYRIKAVPKPHVDHTLPKHDFALNISWNILLDYDYLYGAGKRIKKIEHITASGVVSTKEYDYNYPNGNTTGNAFGIPFFYDVYSIAGGAFFSAYKFPAGPGSPLTNLSGNNVGYSFVNEFEGTKNENVGKTVYEFTNFINQEEYYKFPYHIPNDLDWLRGKVVNQSVFKNVNNNYEIVKHIENEYLYGNSSSYGEVFSLLSHELDLEDDLVVPGTEHEVNRTMFRLPLMTHNTEFDSNGAEIPGSAFYKTYFLTGGTMNLNKSIMTDYFENGILKKETNYYYNYPKHYQVSKTETSSSDGVPIMQEFTFPQDSGNPNTIETALINQNRLIPLETKTYKDFDNDGGADMGEYISKTKSIYSNGFGNSLVLPSIIQTSKDRDNLEDRIIYHKYDNIGNPIEVSKANGAHVFYVWGYDGQYPIAKIENATYSQVSSQLYNLSVLSGLDNDRTVDVVDPNGTITKIGKEGDLREALRNLRNSLPNAMVTTYTYDPLIGVTSVTDPKGYVSYYKYDDFNRLKQVMDAEGKILSYTEYHYNGQ